MTDAPKPAPPVPMAPPPAPLPVKPLAAAGAPAPPVVPPAVVLPPPAPGVGEKQETEVPTPMADAGNLMPSSVSVIQEEDPREPLPDGYVLEDYTLTRKLGQGGFGITYLAKRTKDGTVVVVKEHMPKELALRAPGSTYVMSASPEKEETFRITMEEFLEEVTVMQGLAHPGIVPILSSFAANGTTYYVMPYVVGKPLDIPEKPTLVVAERRREARTIRQRLIAMLDILEYMEQHQVVHRDIKPENIVIGADGHLTLLDFGSARQLRPGKVFSNIYTPDFCAPEQGMAKNDMEMSAKLGAWTDIYALGATFHYLITRMLPPRADMRGYAELDPYKPLATRADLCKLYGNSFLLSIDRALELHPKNRWQTAAEWRQSITSGLVPSSPRYLQRARIIMALSLSLVCIFGGICLWAVQERNQAVQMYNLSLQFSEGILYDFNDELSDVPGATKLQNMIVTQLKNFLDQVESVSVANDEKLEDALATAWRNLGYIYIEQGRLDASTEALLRATTLQEKLVQDYPENAKYRYNLALIWLYRAEVARRRNLAPTASQLVERATAELRALWELSPGNPDYCCALGRALDLSASIARANGNAEQYGTAVEEQLSLYSGQVEKTPRITAVQVGYAYALLSAGQLAMDREDFGEALTYFEKGKQIFYELATSNPYRLSFKKGLATAYNSMGMLHSRMAEHDEDNRATLRNAALRDYDQQLRLAQELYQLDPDNAEYMFLQCHTMALMVDILLDADQQNKAVDYCNSILEMTEILLRKAPDNADYAMLKANALRGLAVAHGTNGFEDGLAGEEIKQSRNIMEGLLNQTPGNISMRYLYMGVLEESAKHAAARGDVRQARSWLEIAIAMLESAAAENPQNKQLEARLTELRKLLSELPGE